MPTLRQLSYLVAIAEERHFGRAARRSHVAQPTLSTQLAALEGKLGARLVERAAGRVALTPLGRDVVARARRVLDEVQDIVDTAARAQHGLGGTLNLGAPPTLGPYLLPHIVPPLHRDYPGLKLYVKEGTPRDMQEALAAGRLDMLLTPLPVVHRNLEVARLFREPLLAVAAPDHPLANRDRPHSRDLRGERVLTLEAGHHLHDQVLDLCNDLGATLLDDYAGTSLDTLRHMVGMGVGISFFPALYVHSEIRDRSEVTVLDLEDLALEREIGVAWRAASGLADAYRGLADAFADFVAPVTDAAGRP